MSDSVCVQWQNTSAQTSSISSLAPVNGSPIVVSASNQFAGSIDSITWNGTEFVNSWDHGREFQSAVTFNSRGECENPTEAGSRADDVGALSNSLLKTLRIVAPNQLMTTSNPAYWLTTGEISPGCGGVASTVPGQPSNMEFSKLVTIGVPSAANAIKYTASFITPTAKTQSTFEIVAAYTRGRTFTDFYRFNPATNTLTQVFPAIGSNTGGSPVPPLLSTTDTNFAVGLMAHHVTGISYDMFNATEASRSVDNATTKMNAAVAGGALVAGAAKQYTAYIVLGTLAQVQTGMIAVQNNE